eukprot:g72255.t1
MVDSDAFLSVTWGWQKQSDKAEVKTDCPEVETQEGSKEQEHEAENRKMIGMRRSRTGAEQRVAMGAQRTTRLLGKLQFTDHPFPAISMLLT